MKIAVSYKSGTIALVELHRKLVNYVLRDIAAPYLEQSGINTSELTAEVTISIWPRPYNTKKLVNIVISSKDDLQTNQSGKIAFGLEDLHIATWVGKADIVFGTVHIRGPGAVFLIKSALDQLVESMEN